ncbi:MAG: PIN domain-containing protein [Actinomycetota bacterium]|nr:PIN domain-containing protein [Actinomycetota bacterium]
MRRLLDADVLIGALDSRDAHHAGARRLLTRWRQQQDAVTISVVNLSEVLTAPAAAPGRLATAREAIAALGIEVHLPNQTIGVEAARLRQRHPISLPDAYCLATAKYIKSSLASFDQKVLRAARNEGLDAS